MPVRAENDPKFYRRFLWMGLVLIGFTLWCLYDGIIVYPREQERAVAFEKLYAEGRVDEWREYAQEKGWSAKIPSEAKSEEEHKSSIMEQYAMAGMSALIGLWLLSLPLRARGRWIELTDSGLTSSWGQSLSFDQVIELNKRQWRGKGIAKVTYLDGGRKRRFVIDDYKFERHPTDAILYELEQRIGYEKITGGPPEPPPEEHAEEAADAASEPSGHPG